MRGETMVIPGFTRIDYVAWAAGLVGAVDRAAPPPGMNADEIAAGVVMGLNESLAQCGMEPATLEEVRAVFASFAVRAALTEDAR